MGTRWCACLAFVMLGVVCFGAEQGGSDATSGKERVGIWTGTWDGADAGSGSGGGFELTLERGKEGTTVGGVSVTGEPTYKATLKTLVLEDQKMSATYDFPPDDRVEITLAATFDGNTAKGTWSARGKDGGGEVATGHWTVKRK